MPTLEIAKAQSVTPRHGLKQFGVGLAALLGAFAVHAQFASLGPLVEVLLPNALTQVFGIGEKRHLAGLFEGR